jgi:hypothetical protein
MLIEVALTKEIVNESLPVHYRHLDFKQRFLPYIAPIFLCIYGVFYTVAAFTNDNFWVDIITPAFMFILALVYFLVIRHRQHNAGKQILKKIGDRTHHEIEVSEEELITRMIDATYNQKWTVYPKAVISKEVVLLYQQNKMFAIFHHSFFANDDFDKFKQLVRNRVHQVIED